MKNKYCEIKRVKVKRQINPQNVKLVLRDLKKLLVNNQMKMYVVSKHI